MIFQIAFITSALLNGIRHDDNLRFDIQRELRAKNQLPTIENVAFYKMALAPAKDPNSSNSSSSSIRP